MDVQHLALGRKKRHPFPRDALFVTLVLNICAVLGHLTHPPERLCMVLKWLVECGC